MRGRGVLDDSPYTVLPHGDPHASDDGEVLHALFAQYSEVRAMSKPYSPLTFLGAALLLACCPSCPVRSARHPLFEAARRRKRVLEVNGRQQRSRAYRSDESGIRLAPGTVSVELVQSSWHTPSSMAWAAAALDADGFPWPQTRDREWAVQAYDYAPIPGTYWMIASRHAGAEPDDRPLIVHSPEISRGPPGSGADAA